MAELEKWYHVVIYPKAFGFASKGGVITKHPDKNWEGKTLQDYKPYLIQRQAEVFVINTEL